MKVIRFLVLLMLLFSTSACASNTSYWLTSSPYVVGQAVLPNTFIINIGMNSADITVPAYQTVGGTAIILWYDVSNVNKESFYVRGKACIDTLCSNWSPWKLVSKKPIKPKIKITNSEEMPEVSILDIITEE
jgi:hypothetical protein